MPAAARPRSSPRRRRRSRPPPSAPPSRPPGTLSQPGAPPPRPPSSSRRAATRTVRSPPRTPATVTGSRPPRSQTSTNCRRPSCLRYFPICPWMNVAFLHPWSASTGVTFVWISSSGSSWILAVGSRSLMNYWKKLHPEVRISLNSTFLTAAVCLTPACVF